MLCDQPVGIVKNFKYLVTMIDCKLNFSDNVDLLCKKANQIPVKETERNSCEFSCLAKTLYQFNWECFRV